MFKNRKSESGHRTKQTFAVRQIEVGKRNDNETVVLKGLKEGEVVTLENPSEAARKQKKL